MDKASTHDVILSAEDAEVQILPPKSTAVTRTVPHRAKTCDGHRGGPANEEQLKQGDGSSHNNSCRLSFLDTPGIISSALINRDHWVSLLQANGDPVQKLRRLNWGPCPNCLKTGDGKGGNECRETVTAAHITGN